MLLTTLQTLPYEETNRIGNWDEAVRCTLVTELDGRA